jgi:hypothetical protein
VLSVALHVGLKPAESKYTLSKRHAALVRWKNEGKGVYSLGDLESVRGELGNLLPAASSSRNWRTRESDHFAGTRRDYSAEDLHWWCQTMSEKRLKWTEYEELYKEGRLRVPPSTIKAKLFREPVDAWKALATDGHLTQMGAPPKVQLPTVEA